MVVTEVGEGGSAETISTAKHFHKALPAEFQATKPITPHHKTFKAGKGEKGPPSVIQGPRGRQEGSSGRLG